MRPVPMANSSVSLGGEPGQECDGLLFVTAGVDGVVPLRHLTPEARIGVEALHLAFLPVGRSTGYRRAGHMCSEFHSLDAAAKPGRAGS